MDIKEGITVSGIDVYGNYVEGKVIGTMSTMKIAAVQIGEDRLNRTMIEYNQIDKK